MKTLLNLLIIAALATTSAFADAKVKAGPRKGLILDLGGKQAEFLVKIAFEVKDGKVVSTTKLPEGEGYQVVVQAKSTPDAKTKNFRIKLQLYICKGCGNAEYACTCDE